MADNPVQQNNNAVAEPDIMTVGDFMNENKPGQDQVMTIDDFNNGTQSNPQDYPPLVKQDRQNFIQQMGSILHAGFNYGAANFQDLIGEGNIPYFKPGIDEGRKEGLAAMNAIEADANFGSKVAKQVAFGMGSMGSTLPIDIMTGMGTKLAMASTKIASMLSVIPDFALGSGWRGLMSGFQKSQQKGENPIQSDISAVKGAAENVAVNTVMGTAGTGMKGLSIMAGLGGAQVMADKMGQGQVPSKEELSNGAAQGAAYWAVFKIMPTLAKATQIGPEKSALNSYIDQIQNHINKGDAEGIQGVIGAALKDENIRPEVKDVLSTTLKEMDAEVPNAEGTGSETQQGGEQAQGLEQGTEGGVHLRNPAENRMEAQTGTEINVNPMTGMDETNVQPVSDFKYVKDEPLGIFNKANKEGDIDLKQTGDESRKRFVGAMKEQIVRMNQWRDEQKLNVKDKLQRQGAFWEAAGAEGDPVRTKEFIARMEALPTDDPRKEYWERIKPEVEASLELKPETEKMISQGNQYYKEAGQVGMNRGSLKAIRENYGSARLYEPESPEKTIKVERGQNLKQSTGHGQQRFYENAFDAVLGGKRFATTDYPDLVANHNEELAYVNKGRQMVEEMTSLDDRLGKWTQRENVPQGWKQVGTMERSIPLVDKDGNSFIHRLVFAAPEEIAKSLEAVTDPNYLRKINELSVAGKVNGFVKSFNVALSFFHHKQFFLQTLYSKGGEGILAKWANIDKQFQSPEWQKNEQYGAKVGLTTSEGSANIDVITKLMDVEGNWLDKLKELPVVKQTLKIVDANNQLLFNKLQRFSKVNVFTQRRVEWDGKNPDATEQERLEAHRGIAEAVNNTYGGQNWEMLGVTKSSQALARLVAFAPDWLISAILHTKAALTDWKALGGPGTNGAIARANIIKGVVVGQVLTNMANVMTTGHTSLQNKKGHYFEWETSPNVYTNFMSGATGELVKFLADVADNGQIRGALRYFTYKASPIVRAFTEAYNGVDYAGRSIWKGKNDLEKNINGLLAVAQSIAPEPFALQASSRDYLLSNKGNPVSKGLVATGLSRVSHLNKKDE